jgi:hypothetical protein
MASGCNEFISVLFHARNQAHIFHLQTKSFARHSALGSFYDSIVDLADRFVEAYQGKYGILKGYKAEPDFEEGDDAVLSFFASLERYVANHASKLPKDPDLVNIHADILDLIHTTQYKLKHLS